MHILLLSAACLPKHKAGRQASLGIFLYRLQVAFSAYQSFLKYFLFLYANSFIGVYLLFLLLESIIPSSSLVYLSLPLVYLDAGLAKYQDGGWSWSAAPPALDAYLRHTPTARFLRRYLLGPRALALLSPTVVAAECAFPLALVAPLCAAGPKADALVRSVAILAGCLHIGIGLGMNGALLLSAGAIVAWTPLWPSSGRALAESPRAASSEPNSMTSDPTKRSPTSGARVGSLVLFLFGAACTHFEFVSKTCAEPKRDTFRTILHNRWNVFAGTESEVWKIL